MSMSTHVVGFRPPDVEWQKMKNLFDACMEANIGIPPDVERFFNQEEPDDNGVEVELEETDACCEWCDESRIGFEIDITKLPQGLKIVRFYNSY